MRSALRTSRLLFIALLIALPQGSAAQTDGPVHHVLFVGNSYTYMNSLPQLFKALSEHALPGHRVEVKFVGGGGATLERHWEVAEAQAEISSGRWEWVVLQGQSMLGSSDLTASDAPDTFFEYARKFDREIEESGARTVFYMTWSRENQPQLQRYLSYAYMRIGLELGRTVAPVGLVWEKVRANPTVNLYQSDGSHPQIAGSYLAAATLLAAIFDIQPQELPGELYGHEILRGGALSADERRLSDISAEQVNVILASVRQVMASIPSNPKRELHLEVH